MVELSSNCFDLGHLRVVIAGGSRGIGRAIALAFARSGAAVSICARGEQALEDARAALAAFGNPTHAAVCDLAEGSAIEHYIGAAADALGGIDVLINNASAFGFADDEAAWSSGFKVDVMAAVRASRTALPWLAASASPSILHTVSIAAFHPTVRSAPYAALKAALVQYTSSQALTLAPQRIRVNAIAPGSIEFTDGLWARRRTEDPALYQATLEKIPFGRFGHPDEVAAAALFLASPAASWITGQTLAIDGGQALSG